MEQKTDAALFASVIVDIAHAAIDRLFTYACPAELNVSVGSHVRVPFGAGKGTKEGFVLSLTNHAPEGLRLKAIHAVIEPYPILLADQIQLAFWLKANYHCLLVDALRLMIPPELRQSRVHDKIEKTVALSPAYDVNQMRLTLLKKDGTPRSPKQLEVFDFLANANTEVATKDLTAFIPNAASAIAALTKRGYLVTGGHISFRTPMPGASVPDKTVHLTEKQEAAVQAVRAARDTASTFLLHGVTGSGKTEVYMHCIEESLKRGCRAILLVPEISLTPQAIGLFRARFSDKIAVLHSKLSPGERFDEWRRIRLGYADVVIGARSAIFAPVEKLDLIIVDEEHEPSYQSEMTPRYHAVDVARKRGALVGCTTILGSATPQLISYYRAVNGVYRLLRLPDRVNRRPLPAVEIVDMRQEFLSGNNGIFSASLIRRLRGCFDAGHQAMLFLNRRGYSTFISCRACGHVIQCPNCDLSMTYHKRENHLQCHFCGETAPLPTACPLCGKPFIKAFGIGTEQVEEQARALFPEVSVLRMDTDTVKHKNDLSDMLSRFSRGEAKLLIGTQMIAKGHDFPNVTLVGVIAADSSLRLPDYRSTARTFELLTQVAGRAGRDENPGRVIVQTYSPEHPAILFAKNHDYEGFFRYELNERKKAIFPPFSLFIRILFTGQDEASLQAIGDAVMQELETRLKTLLTDRYAQTVLMLSSSPAPIQRKNKEYRHQVLLKLLRTEDMGRILRTVYAYADEHRTEVFASIEINPTDML